MNILIHPTYFPSIAHFVAIAKATEVRFEMEDNFIKQTYRNRAYIYGANGKLALNVPIIHSQKNRQKYRDVKIFNEEQWQSVHWKSLLSAYSTSPFFEFYKDELAILFQKPFHFILDFNLICFEILCDCLQLDPDTTKSDMYRKSIESHLDLRYLVQAKKEQPQDFRPYTQVFNSKHGFIPNLSVLDLLFNEGPNALTYLKSQEIR
ncbi:WbqC family protein [Aestuariivivens sediminis]|uniref:WbqC family protein n=1 Tax=Aestuariivivens sediminis TaxID=2913557 RepID=UPI001F580F80|nr:WbqC family protein [Aestuariivivens sediminis]